MLATIQKSGRAKTDGVCVCVRVCVMHSPKFIACPATHISHAQTAWQPPKLHSTPFQSYTQHTCHPARHKHAIRNKSTATQQAISPPFSLGACFGCIWLVKADRGLAMPQRRAEWGISAFPHITPEMQETQERPRSSHPEQPLTHKHNWCTPKMPCHQEWKWKAAHTSVI